MTGKLYVIGVGPGDPELLTLKAIRLLSEVRCICVPKGREEGSSLALSIVEKAINLRGKEIIEAYFPMKKTKGEDHACHLDAKWHATVETLLSMLSQGTDTAFITIGDPMVYSTFFYLYDRLLELDPDLNVEFIPGISSINTAAARSKTSLGLADEKIAILPATYTENLRDILEKFDTVVLMKVHRVFSKVLDILEEAGLSKNAVYIAKAGMRDERIIRDLSKVKTEDLSYFSVVIVKK